MNILTTTADLATFCTAARNCDYVTMDTEFLRERTYYSKLCLLQMALPKQGGGQAVLVDTLAPGLSLSPLQALFADTSVTKVFHAARQDLEIFWQAFNLFPTPLFDTQVAAMVCGYGEQVGYETLVRRIAGETLDKSSRFTDWSRRPLSAAQQTYALADVTHLRVIYETLAADLTRRGRASWVEEEHLWLTDPATYDVDPDAVWQKIKLRNHAGRFLACAKELAAFRERYAQTKDLPRNRVFKDDALAELAALKPQTVADLSQSRLLLRDARKGAIAEGILAAVERAVAYPTDRLPKVPSRQAGRQVNPALADLLRVLLKAKSEETEVAQKMIATVGELDALAAGERDLPSLKGWRRDVFGHDALRLCDGDMGLAVRGQKVVLIPINPHSDAPA